MGKKTDRKRRAQHKAQKARAQARERALPPGPVAVECRDDSGRPIDAICYPPEERWALERGRWRRRFYSPRWSETRARWMGLDLSRTPDRSALVVICGETGRILDIDPYDLQGMARRSAGHRAR